MITKTAAEGLNKEWEGQIIDKNNLKKLKKIVEKHKISIMGEGGEYETLVLNAPFYSKELKFS